MATHSSVLACRIPWTEEAGGPQSMGSQRVGHDWANNTTSLSFILLHAYAVLRSSVMSDCLKTHGL